MQILGPPPRPRHCRPSLTTLDAVKNRSGEMHGVKLTLAVLLLACVDGAAAGGPPTPSRRVLQAGQQVTGRMYPIQAVPVVQGDGGCRAGLAAAAAAAAVQDVPAS